MPKHVFQKGNKGGGRHKGVPNKINTDLKEMVLGALSDVGGQQYLARQAHENPKAFLALVGKVFPSTIIDNSTNNTLQVNMSEIVKKALMDSDRMYKELQALKAGQTPAPLAIEATYTEMQPIEMQGEIEGAVYSNPAIESHDMVAGLMYVDGVTLKGEM